jgi:hypothetical protein
MGEWRNGGLGSVRCWHWRDRLVLGMEHAGRDGDGEADDGRGQSAKRGICFTFSERVQILQILVIRNT